MYDFYPEWGPARHRDEEPQPAVRRARSWSATAMATTGAPEPRDGAGERPDDN